MPESDKLPLNRLAVLNVFNFFKPLSPLWRELGDPTLLERLDKV